MSVLILVCFSGPDEPFGSDLGGEQLASSRGPRDLQS